MEMYVLYVRHLDWRGRGEEGMSEPELGLARGAKPKADVIDQTQLPRTAPKTKHDRDEAKPQPASEVPSGVCRRMLAYAVSER